MDSFIIKKINLIKKISKKLFVEFPGITIKVNKITKKNVIFEIFHNTTKTDKKINKFNTIDGGRKNKIITKLKYLLKEYKTNYNNYQNIFLI